MKFNSYTSGLLSLGPLMHRSILFIEFLILMFGQFSSLKNHLKLFVKKLSSFHNRFHKYDPFIKFAATIELLSKLSFCYLQGFHCFFDVKNASFSFFAEKHLSGDSSSSSHSNNSIASNSSFVISLVSIKRFF